VIRCVWYVACDGLETGGGVSKMMLERLAMQRTAVRIGAMVVVALLAVDLMLPRAWREILREDAFDLVLAADLWLRPKVEGQRGPRVVVVDLDRHSLEALGSWPWPRATMARLIEALVATKPALIAVDILFAEPDFRSPAALARQLGALTARAELSALADELPDGDKRLSEAGNGIPLIFGFVLDPERSNSLPQVSIVMRGSPSLDRMWRAAGAVVPMSLLTERASGIGALSVPASSDGVIRYVPLLVGVGGSVLPGLALEAVRLARGASHYLLQADPPVLSTADVKIPFAPDGLLRLLPVAPEWRAARTISAIDVVQGKANSPDLAGAIVLIGGSAPELGGLRATVSDPLTPSVQIQADAVQQIFAGRFPHSLTWENLVNRLLFCGVGVVGIVTGAALPPALGVFVMIGIVVLTWVSSIAGSLVADRLTDPLTPSLAAAAVFVATSVTSFAVTYRREALVRQRFEQHLAPAVVRLIVQQPDLVKLSGERREVTSLFTDVEEFTAMTHRADPEGLVAVLDAYFEGLAGIIVANGGMVDKIVGDAVHALFNAPLDLADHPRRAVECAIAIHSWTQSYRATPAPSAIRFGRTRIGIETGQVVVGDVGMRSKLDYTAYGDAVNAAARFEAANKQLGSAICVGPAAAARCDSAIFRPLGTISVRGREESLAVFEPWPIDTPAEWRDRYLAAFETIGPDPMVAAALFETLAAERLDDSVPRILANRVRAEAAHRQLAADKKPLLSS
jgi:adenylate cyclase